MKLRIVYNGYYYKIQRHVGTIPIRGKPVRRPGGYSPGALIREDEIWEDLYREDDTQKIYPMRFYTNADAMREVNIILKRNAPVKEVIKEYNVETIK